MLEISLVLIEVCKYSVEKQIAASRNVAISRFVSGDVRRELLFRNRTREVDAKAFTKAIMRET